MPIVTPVGTVDNPTQWMAEVQQYAALLTQKWGDPTLSQDYITYMEAHANASPEIVYETVNARLAILGDVPGVIGEAAGADINTAAGAAGDIPKGIKAISPDKLPAWLEGFLTANGVLRIAEGAVGALILAVSLDKLLDGNAGIVSTIAKVAK